MLNIYDTTFEECEVLNEKWNQFRHSRVPFIQEQSELEIYRCIKDNGKVVAGIEASIYGWNAVSIEELWVDESYRNRGFASALLKEVEEYARKKGCNLSHVETWDFQASGMYEKNGYVVFGISKENVGKYNDNFLSKRLEVEQTLSDIEIVVSTAEEAEFVSDELLNYNVSCVPIKEDSTFIHINKCIKIEGSIVGSLSTLFIRGWNIMIIDHLWFDEQFQNRGFATALFTEVEKAAVNQGGHVISVITYDFHAKDFYKKQGFEINGILENCPQGYNRYYMSKKL